jgi:hypothetical protein
LVPQKPTHVLNPPQLLRLVINVLFVGTFMQLMTAGIAVTNSNAAPKAQILPVAYSTFLRAVAENQVSAVQVDDVFIAWSPRVPLSDKRKLSEHGQELQSRLREAGAEGAQVTFSTTRPSDVTTPYAELLANDVTFGSPDHRDRNKWSQIQARAPTFFRRRQRRAGSQKRGGMPTRALNPPQAYAVWAVVLLFILSRLPMLQARCSRAPFSATRSTQAEPSEWLSAAWVCASGPAEPS